MSLVPVANKEMGVCVAPIEVDNKIIDTLIAESIEVTDEIYLYFKNWLAKQLPVEKPKSSPLPNELKKLLASKQVKLWTHSFPFADPLSVCNILKSDANEFELHDLEIFDLLNIKVEDRKKILSLNFRKSHAYIWIEKKLKQRPDGIFFGELSKLIHESLYDDPTPYRRQVKELQKNLYDYLKFLDYDNIKIDVPHSHSERIRILIS